MPEHALLAIDPATTGAFAYRAAGRLLAVPYTLPAIDTPGQRGWRFCALVERMAGLSGAAAVVYELPGHQVSSANAARRYALETALLMACDRMRLPALPAWPSEWQAWAVPKEWRPAGRLKREQWKPLIARAARERFGAPEGWTQDCYDACCLLHWAEAHAKWKAEVPGA